MTAWVGLILWVFLVPNLGLADPSILESKTQRKQADAFFMGRQESGKAKQALESYRNLHEADPKDLELAWKLSMAAHFFGLRFEKDPEKRKTLFQEGIDAGMDSLALNPQCGPCHFWTGINLALHGQEVGAFKMFFRLPEIKEHLFKAAELDPKHALAGPYRILGALYQRLPGILGGSDSTAEKYFKKAIELLPFEPLNYWALAKLYRENMDEPLKATETIKEGLKASEGLQNTEIESIEARQEMLEWKEAVERVTP